MVFHFSKSFQIIFYSHCVAIPSDNIKFHPVKTPQTPFNKEPMKYGFLSNGETYQGLSGGRGTTVYEELFTSFGSGQLLYVYQPQYTTPKVVQEPLCIFKLKNFKHNNFL